MNECLRTTFASIFVPFALYIWQVFPYSLRSLPQREWCEHIGNRHILLMLSGGKTGLAYAPQKAHGTQMKEMRTLCVCISLRRLWAHLHGLVCVYVQVCVHIGVFQSACWQTVSWLMSSCRPSLFMSPVTLLPSQSTSTWKPQSLISTAAE